MNDALDGDGPFSPERSGSLPTGPLVSVCFSGEHTHAEVWKMLVGGGGMYRLSRHERLPRSGERIRSGDAKAQEVYEAMAYQIAKWVGASAAVLSGKVKAVVVTGGMARSRLLVGLIRKYAGFVAPFVVYPEVEEMIALATRAAGRDGRKIKVQEYLKGKRGQAPFVQSTLRAVPANGACPLFPRSIVRCLALKSPRNCARAASCASRSVRRTASNRATR